MKNRNPQEPMISGNSTPAFANWIVGKPGDLRVIERIAAAGVLRAAEDMAMTVYADGVYRHERQCQFEDTLAVYTG